MNLWKELHGFGAHLESDVTAELPACPQCRWERILCLWEEKKVQDMEDDGESIESIVHFLFDEKPNLRRRLGRYPHADDCENRSASRMRRLLERYVASRHPLWQWTVIVPVFVGVFAAIFVGIALIARILSLVSGFLNPVLEDLGMLGIILLAVLWLVAAIAFFVALPEINNREDREGKTRAEIVVWSIVMIVGLGLAGFLPAYCNSLY